MPDSSLNARFKPLAESLASAVRDLAAQGWTPATSSNFSLRVDAEHLAITVSGRDKSRLTREDVMLTDAQGRPLQSDLKPSAETALHVQLYQRLPEVGAVLHTHSLTQTVASRCYAAAGEVRLSGWELQKAIAGEHSHDGALVLPVFPNSQHMPDITARVAAWLDAGRPLVAYLIAGHGIYTWGRDLREARRHLEALEFLLACELDLRRLAP